MVIRKINSLEKFKQMEAYWNHLLQESGSNHIHSTFEWLYTWWKYFGKNKELFILVAEEDNEIIGIAPLMIEKIPKIYKNILRQKRISFLGTGHLSGFTDSADILIAKNREKVLTEFFKYLFSKNKLWDEIHLRQISSTSPNFPLLRAKDLVPRKYDSSLHELVHSPYLKVEGDFETYFKGLGKRWRREINRKKNRLERDGISMNFEVIENIDEDFLEKIHKLNLERNTEPGRKSMFLDINKYSFLKEIIPELGNKKRAKFFLIMYKDQIIAYQLAFDYDNVMFFWNTTYSLDYKNYSMGSIIMFKSIKYCFDNNYKICDFMVGDEDYKYHWTSDRSTNFIYHVDKHNIKTKINKLVNSSKNLVKAKIK